MQVNGFNPLGLINQSSSSKLVPGQRLFVEIINKKPSGEGIILLEGQKIPALMEISAGVGDKIWVKIREITDNGLLLVREQQQNSLEISNTSNGEKSQTILVERGLQANDNIVKVLENFSNAKQELVFLLQNLNQESLSGLTSNQGVTIAQVLQVIPQWANLSGENGAEQILQLLKALGIDYEARLNQVLKAKGENQGKGLQELLSTLKPLILKILEDNKNLLSAQHHKIFEEILDQLTGQQLWLRTGDQENAYVLMHFPFQDNERMLLAKVAIESTRRGNKMDIDHCHLALQIETRVLGDVGVDLWFYEDNLSLKVLTSQPEILTPLLEQILPLTKDKFSQIGFNLRSVETGHIDTNQEFRRFIIGQRKKGVDLHI
ncbi:MAG: hypothetical protein ACYDEJ_04155 [Desulfitobacteriaceae bacterium]